MSSTWAEICHYWRLITWNSYSRWQPAFHKQNPCWWYPVLSACCLRRGNTGICQLVFQVVPMRKQKAQMGNAHSKKQWLSGELTACRATSKAVSILIQISWSCPTTRSPKEDSWDWKYGHFNTHVKWGMGQEIYGWSHWRKRIYQTTRGNSEAEEV